MALHHDHDYVLALESIFDNGYVEVAKTRVRRWFKIKHRLKASHYKDIETRWTAIAKEEGYAGISLLLADTGDTLLFVWGENLKLEDDTKKPNGWPKGWLLPLAVYANRDADAD